ncbi:hypothetical protein [Mucilaginibacter sp. FT3.2]|uniref:hypothetical protein n=1 Tax=Mucilaginibacter sp. FT3.2 TaxID=2723090 RepID=UPI001610A92B|nr:hypothetical protein [Mucilaginibacter sp. FT3.2]MBB6231902.1 hypothetical protein [Mucilaginibacter sp. FT3.2]
MRKPNQLSTQKKIKIVSENILFKPDQGKYFPIKNLNPRNNIPQVRLRILPEFYKSFLDGVLKSPNWTDVILNGKNKRTVRDLDSPRLVQTDVDSEYFWAKYIILINLPYIKKFLDFSQAYSRHLMAGQYQDAKQALDGIEDNFGASLWLIRNKIALLQITEGLEAQKKYAQAIKSNLRNGGLIKFLVHHTSIRNEPQTSTGRFTSQIESITSLLNSDGQVGYDDFSRYYLLGTEPSTLEGLANILRLSYSTSIIDYYEAFVLLIQRFSCIDPNKYGVRVYSYFLSESQFVKDPRFEIMKAILGFTHNLDRLKSVGINSYELFLQGHYRKAYDNASYDLKNDPTDVMSLLAKAYSRVMIDQNINEINVEENEDYNYLDTTLGDVIVGDISKVFQNGIEGASREFNNLMKLTLNFSCFSWTTAIKLALEREYFLSSSKSSFAFPTAKDEKLLPVCIDLIKDDTIANIYTDLCYKTYDRNTVSDYYKTLRKSDFETVSTDITQVQSDLIKSYIHFNNQNFDKVIKYAVRLRDFNIGFFIRSGFGLQTKSYLKENNLKMACITAADCYIYNRSYHSYLPLKEFSELILPGSGNWKELNSLIDLSIIFDACVRHLDQSFETARRFAYEDFLNKNGIEKPSELKDISGSVLNKKTLYYLRYICAESTMDMSGAFEGGTEEVLAERLFVCRWLTEVDPDNEQIYKQEINDLVRRQVILNRRQEFDQSRVYVDIVSVKDWAETELKETYARYQAYLRHGVSSINDYKVFEQFIIDNQEQINAPKINVPTNEVLALLTSMIRSIGRSYLSADVGLDRFISTRIRHGELERTMRIPLQKHNLITKKQVKSGPYLRNDFWLVKLLGYSETTIGKLDQAFAIFSESYDALITEIANSWLQIVKPSTPNGLFDFAIFAKDYQRIYDNIDRDTTLPQFIDNVIALFDNKLIFILVEIRQKLNKVARTQAKGLLNNLQEAALSETYSPFIELQGAISQARTDLQAQFDKIIEWFIPSATGNSTPYQIEDAIWVADAIIKEENPIFDVEIDSQEFDFSIHGQLPIFIDIFINIFGNVVKRSGLDHPKAFVKIWPVEVLDDYTIIHCEVTNDLGPDIDVVALDVELQKKLSILNNGNYLEFLASDKNSGLFKIYRSVRDLYVAEFPTKPSVDFGVKNRRFQINLSVPFKVFRLEAVEQI